MTPTGVFLCVSWGGGKKKKKKYHLEKVLLRAVGGKRGTSRARLAELGGRGGCDRLGGALWLGGGRSFEGKSVGA